MSLVVLVGVPGAGKTTFANRFSASLMTVTRDDIAYSADQRREWLDQINELLGRGHDVIADSTGTSRETRDLLRALAKSHGVACIAIVFDDVEQALRRNAERETPIKPDAMVGLVRKFEEARWSLSEEGFDHLLWAT